MSAICNSSHLPSSLPTKQHPLSQTPSLIPQATAKQSLRIQPCVKITMRRWVGGVSCSPAVNLMPSSPPDRYLPVHFANHLPRALPQQVCKHPVLPSANASNHGDADSDPEPTPFAHPCSLFDNVDRVIKWASSSAALGLIIGTTETDEGTKPGGGGQSAQAAWS